MLYIDVNPCYYGVRMLIYSLPPPLFSCKQSLRARMPAAHQSPPLLDSDWLKQTVA